ncbi:uncharacterized protein LOC135466417 [Liolophura sinensis]|uniref:uncharacterized protein LOC135466417 n=1 Tax=Liolophura sinensis TaxID=3198878 RepID=UPI003158026D
MDFKLLRLLLPIMATVGLVVSQNDQMNAVPLAELLQKCSGMDAGMSVGLNADCRTYAVCPERYNMRQFPIQFCAPGTLFDSVLNQCNAPEFVDCAGSGLADPCAGQADGNREDAMRSGPAKGAVLVCQEGRTVGGVSCNQCEQYSPNSETGCSPIPDCVRNEPQFTCNLEVNPENSAQFIALAPGGNIVMDCSNGTVFNQEACGCVVFGS